MSVDPRTSRKTDPQADLFTTVYADIPIRDQRETMERPFFSLAKRPRFAPIEYNVGNVSVRVTANKEHGIATIWDGDILIWAASQITEKLDRGEQPSRTLHFPPYNLLKAIRRGTSGREYERLRAAMRRLAATYVETNIRAKNRKGSGFHWLEAWNEELNEDDSPKGMSITLPDWFFQGVLQSGGVLTIHEDYFELKGGIERWLYRVCRKHAGHQENGWSFTVRQLYEKSGSVARFSDFALDIREAAKDGGRLPEYALSLSKNGEGDEIVHIHQRCLLDFTDPRYQPARHPRRRLAGGITSKPEL